LIQVWNYLLGNVYICGSVWWGEPAFRCIQSGS
jgi:hypothetical protein